MNIDADLIVPDESKSLIQGCIEPIGEQPRGSWYGAIMKSLSKHYGFSFATPWKILPEKVKKILNEAKLQRELLLKEAREIRSKIIADAETEATEKANKLIESAKTAIENEKSAAMKELNNTVVDLSLNIAISPLWHMYLDFFNRKDTLSIGICNGCQGVVKESYGIEISMIEWSKFGLPCF